MKLQYHTSPKPALNKWKELAYRCVVSKMSKMSSIFSIFHLFHKMGIIDGGRGVWGLALDALLKQNDSCIRCVIQSTVSPA